MKGAGYLACLGALVVLSYAAACWWYPFGRCWCLWGCEGGKHHSKTRKTHRDCRWCRGSGRRLRIGRRIYNYFEHARRAARKASRP